MWVYINGQQPTGQMWDLLPFHEVSGQVSSGKKLGFMNQQMENMKNKEINNHYSLKQYIVTCFHYRNM
jgi:hypothetical protein